jgi:hypothetical protein
MKWKFAVVNFTTLSKHAPEWNSKNFSEVRKQIVAKVPFICQISQTVTLCEYMMYFQNLILTWQTDTVQWHVVLTATYTDYLGTIPLNLLSDLMQVQYMAANSLNSWCFSRI